MQQWYNEYINQWVATSVYHLISNCLDHSQNELKGQEALETMVNGSKGIFRLGSQGVNGRFNNCCLTDHSICCGQRVKQSILRRSKGQALKWWVTNFDQWPWLWLQRNMRVTTSCQWPQTIAINYLCQIEKIHPSYVIHCLHGSGFCCRCEQ